jgi:hypothetical protein
MVQTKPVPNGIDIPIQRFSIVLYNYLTSLWGLASTAYAAYGRAYRNQTDDGYVPQVWNQTTGHYNEVLYNDTLSALSFFGVGDTTIYDVEKSSTSIADVFLIFMVNVPAIKPVGKFTPRADEEIRLDVEQFCQQERFGFRMQSFITGIDSVFKEYPGSWVKDGMKFRDLDPKHCFRINFKCYYDINNNISSLSTYA